MHRNKAFFHPSIPQEPSPMNARDLADIRQRAHSARGPNREDALRLVAEVEQLQLELDVERLRRKRAEFMLRAATQEAPQQSKELFHERR
jgi:hypothetical protein